MHAINNVQFPATTAGSDPCTCKRVLTKSRGAHRTLDIKPLAAPATPDASLSLFRRCLCCVDLHAGVGGWNVVAFACAIFHYFSSFLNTRMSRVSAFFFSFVKRMIQLHFRSPFCSFFVQKSLWLQNGFSCLLCRVAMQIQAAAPETEDECKCDGPTRVDERIVVQDLPYISRIRLTLYDSFNKRRHSVIVLLSLCNIIVNHRIMYFIFCHEFFVAFLYPSTT